MRGRLCGAPRSTSLTLRRTRPRNVNHSVRSVRQTMFVFTSCVSAGSTSFTCRGEATSCQRRRWRGPVQRCPGDAERLINHHPVITPLDPLNWEVGVKKPTCRQMARLTREPKAVLTARAERPISLKSLEKDCVRARRGRSSAITTQLRTHDRFRPRAWRSARPEVISHA